MEIETLLKTVLGNSTKRDRQVNIGPSEIGGCRRRVWHRLNQTPVTNEDTLKLASWMGTAIHAAIEQDFENRDPFESRWLREIEVEHNGMMGHVDCYDIDEREVIDWKTTTKKNMSKFPSTQQRTQVHLYGYLMKANGFDVENVTLVAIARDGNERDIKIHTEPYNENYATSGLQWLADIREMATAPAPSENHRFCRDYCPFYDTTGRIGCTGI